MKVKQNVLIAMGLGLISLSSFSYAGDYEWNKNIPVKEPSVQSGNGKTVPTI